MKNKRITILLSLILVISIAGSVGVLYVMHKYITKIDKSISELKSQDEAGAKQLADLNIAELQVKKYQDFSSIASQVLPKVYNQSEINMIVNLAKQSGIGLTSIGVSNGLASSLPGSCRSPLLAYNEVKGVCTVTFHIQPSESISFDQFMNFMNRIEQNRRKILVTNLSLSPTNDKDKPNQLTVSADLNLFTRP